MDTRLGLYVWCLLLLKLVNTQSYDAAYQVDKLWSECTMTCGGGTQYRRGNITMTRYCNMLNCPGDAGCLSAYLSFDHESQRKIFDDSKNRNNAELQGGAATVDGGKFGKALKLSKNGSVTFDVVHFRNRPTKAVTVAFWLKLSKVQGVHAIFFTCGSPWKYNIGAYHIGIDNGMVVWSLKDKGDQEVFSTRSEKPLTSDKWYHIAGTHKHMDGVARLYVDGKIASEVKSRELPSDVSSWECADMGNPREDRPLEGLVDEFYIFKCALLPEEISELFTNNQFKRFYIPRPERTRQLMRDYWSEKGGFQ